MNIASTKKVAGHGKHRLHTSARYSALDRLFPKG